MKYTLSKDKHMWTQQHGKKTDVFLPQPVNSATAKSTAVFRVEGIRQRTGPGPVF